MKKIFLCLLLLIINYTQTSLLKRPKVDGQEQVEDVQKKPFTINQADDYENYIVNISEDKRQVRVINKQTNDNFVLDILSNQDMAQLSPSGKFLVIRSADKKILYVFDARTKELIHELRHKTEFNKIIISNNDKVFTQSQTIQPTPNRVRAWDLRTGRSLFTIDPAETNDALKIITNMSISDDSSLLVTTFFNKYIIIWDIQTSIETESSIMLQSFTIRASGDLKEGFIADQEASIFNLNNYCVNFAKISRDGKLLFICTNTSVLICDVITGKLINCLDHAASASSIVLSNNKQMAIASTHKDKVSIWNLLNNQKISLGNDTIELAKLSQDNQFIALTRNQSEQAKELFDKTNQAKIAKQSLDIRKVLSQLAIPYNYNVEIWDIQNNTKLFTLNHDKVVNQIYISADNSFIITVANDYYKVENNTIYIWDMHTGKLIKTLPLGVIIDSIIINQQRELIINTIDKTLMNKNIYIYRI